jgi:electron transfer flavoprotein alpha subunit
LWRKILARAEVWTFAEQVGGRLKTVSYELLARGRELADKRGIELSSVVLGWGVDRSDLQELVSRGADKVYLAEDPALEHFLVEPYANVMEHLIRSYEPEILIAGATTIGRTLMPYLAIKINTGLTADCTGLDIEEGTGNLLQIRPAIGGNIMATIKTPAHRPQMATVRPKSTTPPSCVGGRKGEIILFQVSPELLKSRVERLGFRSTEEEEANIEDADKIVAGGRGLKKAENFSVIRQLAEKLGAAVGASRDAVDRGWISYPHQVGLSGKTVNPKLYVAVGISGSIQHLAGMKTSDTIVAINIDPDAQIFQVADFGIVGDLFEVVPALVEELEERVRT